MSDVGGPYARSSRADLKDFGGAAADAPGNARITVNRFRRGAHAVGPLSARWALGAPRDEAIKASYKRDIDAFRQALVDHGISTAGLDSLTLLGFKLDGSEPLTAKIVRKAIADGSEFTALTAGNEVGRNFLEEEIKSAEALRNELADSGYNKEHIDLREPPFHADLKARKIRADDYRKGIEAQIDSDKRNVSAYFNKFGTAGSLRGVLENPQLASLFSAFGTKMDAGKRSGVFAAYEKVLSNQEASPWKLEDAFRELRSAYRELIGVDDSPSLRKLLSARPGPPAIAAVKDIMREIRQQQQDEALHKFNEFLRQIVPVE